MFSTVFFIISTLCLFTYVSGSYDCVCNYAVETPVYEAPEIHSQILGYMYEFDCKPKSKLSSPGWEVVEFKHMIGYVMVDEQIQVQICTGDVQPEDRITTETVTSTEHLTSTTSVQRNTMKLLTTTPVEVATKYTTSSRPLSSSASVVSTSNISSALSVTTTHTKTEVITSTTKYSTILNALTNSLSSLNYNVTKPSLSTDTSPAISQSAKTTMTPFISSTSTKPVATAQTFSISSLSGSSLSPDTAPNTTPMHYRNITTTSPIPRNTTIFSESSILAVLTHSTTTTEAPLSSSRLTRASTIQKSTASPSTTAPKYSEHTPSTSSSSRTLTSSAALPTTTSPVLDRVDLCPYQYLANDYNQGSHTYPHFRQFGDYCYEIRLEQKTWNSARDDCDVRGGKLAVNKNNEVEKRIQSLVSTSRTGEAVWIGLRTQDGRYEWVDGTVLANSTLTGKFLSKPGSVSGNGCVITSASGSWRHVACKEAHPWICQYSIL